MAKLSITFDAFSAALPAGFQPVEQSKSIFYARAGKAGKVELNCNSGTYTVGSGSGKRLADVTAAAERAGFEVASRNKGWTVLKFTALADLRILVESVAAAVPATAEKAPRAPKAAKTAVSKADLAAIRAKNLATIKQVAAQFKSKAA